MNKLNLLIATYGAFHEHQFNKLMHFIGVPCIIIGALLLSHHQLFITWLIIFCITIYYLSLDFFLGILTASFFIISNVTIQMIALPHAYRIGLILFIIGWILQLIGHFVEGKRPAFTTNISQIFIAPLFLMAEIFRKND